MPTSADLQVNVMNSSPPVADWTLKARDVLAVRLVMEIAL